MTWCDPAEGLYLQNSSLIVNSGEELSLGSHHPSYPGIRKIAHYHWAVLSRNDEYYSWTGVKVVWRGKGNTSILDSLLPKYDLMFGFVHRFFSPSILLWTHMLDKPKNVKCVLCCFHMNSILYNNLYNTFPSLIHCSEMFTICFLVLNHISGYIKHFCFLLLIILCTHKKVSDLNCKVYIKVSRIHPFFYFFIPFNPDTTLFTDSAGIFSNIREQTYIEIGRWSTRFAEIISLIWYSLISPFMYCRRCCHMEKADNRLYLSHMNENCRFYYGLCLQMSGEIIIIHLLLCCLILHPPIAGK